MIELIELTELPTTCSGIVAYVRTQAGVFSIEQGQEVKIRRRHRSRFPIDALKVGEGFGFAAEDIGTVRSICGYRKRNFGERYQVCRIDTASARCQRIL